MTEDNKVYTVGYRWPGEDVTNIVQYNDVDIALEAAKIVTEEGGVATVSSETEIIYTNAKPKGQ